MGWKKCCNIFLIYFRDELSPHHGLNNNTITAKQEPNESSSPTNRSNHSPPQHYHSSPATSMHLDSNEDIEDKDDIPEDANTKAVVVSEDQPQAEDLSHKSSRSESPATATSASNLKARYHPYCHSEILIKSE